MDVDLDRCLSGDKKAWDAFVGRWSGVIYAAVRRVHGRSGSTEGVDLDDPVQEVFVRLVKDDYRLLRTFDPGRASLSTWLTVVARSVALDEVRKRRLETVSLEEPRHAAPTPEAPPDIPPLPLHVLSPRQRLVLRMLFDEDMSVAEAARTIGVNEQTIRSTKHKALSRLRETLTEGTTTRLPSKSEGMK